MGELCVGQQVGVPFVTPHSSPTPAQLYFMYIKNIFKEVVFAQFPFCISHPLFNAQGPVSFLIVLSKLVKVI